MRCIFLDQSQQWELTKLSGKNLLPKLPASSLLKTSDEGVVEIRLFSGYALLSEINKCLGGGKCADDDDKKSSSSCGTNTTATVFLNQSVIIKLLITALPFVFRVRSKILDR
jgi:hypothetical protein